MAKVYKIKRELLRILNQPRQWPGDFFTYVFGPRYYDWFLSKKRVERHGKQSPSERVAVYAKVPLRLKGCDGLHGGVTKASSGLSQ